MAFIRTVFVTTLALTMVACANAPQARRTSERQAAYAAVTGAPVRNFRFFSLYSWVPLNDTQLVIYTRPSEAYLLDLGGCQDLNFVNTIGLTSNINQVTVGFDKVLTGRNNFPCTITQIRPIDVKSLKAAEQEKRQIRSEPRITGKPGA